MKNIPSAINVLGDISPAQFLKEYWQKKPLLIRGAFPGLKPVLSAKKLFEMAKRDDVESRLICAFDQHWDMSNGPFSVLPDTSKDEWTLLVQGVNLHDKAADSLLRRFNFIPNARLDDLMISYATNGGGVGAHFDSYDVFLLQAHGKRRWRISAQKDLSLIEGMPLKVLRKFVPEQEFELEPGDMLYLPPRYAHEGVAIGECMTYSIGFRAPSFQELGEAFLNFMVDTIELPGRFSDPDLKLTKHPAELSASMLAKVQAQLEQIKFSHSDMAIFLGEYLTEPKASVFFDSPKKPLSPTRFKSDASKNGLVLSLKTQMLYKGGHIFINGESFVVNASDGISLKQLANERYISPEALKACSDDVFEAFCIWYEDGWLQLRDDD